MALRMSTMRLMFVLSVGGLSVAAAGSAAAADEGECVTRERIGLNLAGAERILAAAQEKAQEIGVKVNIAVVDEGGHLLAFARMDGARPASVYTALTKATTAATIRQPTGPIARGGEAPNVLLNLSVQGAAVMSGGKFTTLYGGVPVVVEEQVIGAVGVGGATGEQDAEVARAGVAALVAALKKTPAETKGRDDSGSPF